MTDRRAYYLTPAEAGFLVRSACLIAGTTKPYPGMEDLVERLSAHAPPSKHAPYQGSPTTYHAALEAATRREP